jgi:aspartate aminotransferase
LRSSEEEIGEMVNVFDKRRENLLKLIADIDGVYAVEPDGAFYVMMVVGDLYGKSYGDKQINGSIDFADALLEAEKVATIPGISFGADDCVRLSYSLSDADIQEGLLRIKRFVENLR